GGGPLETIEIATGDNPRASIILLHGLGGQNLDLVPMVKELDLAGIGPVRFIFPQAPAIPSSVSGEAMPAWFDIKNANLRQAEDRMLDHSMQGIRRLIDKERERGTPAQRVVLAGFSQGGAMTLLTGLNYPETLAGLAGMS